MKLRHVAGMICAFSVGCSGVGDFDVTRDTAEVIVEGANNPLMDLLPAEVLPPMALDFDLQSELEKQDASGAQKVRLTGLTMDVTDTAMPDGDEDNFDFLERIEFFVESADSGSSLERRSIAVLDPVPTGVTEVVLETDDSVNLKPYAEEGVVLTTSGRGSTPSDDVSVKGTVTLTIEVL